MALRVRRFRSFSKDGGQHPPADVADLVIVSWLLRRSSGWPLFAGGVNGTSYGVAEIVEEHRVYRRDWHKYNDAQTHEAEDVRELLGGISDLVNEIDVQARPRRDRGRSRSPLGHMLFALIYRAFPGQSARRVQAQLRVLARSGYMPKCDPPDSVFSRAEDREPWIPCFNSITGYYGYDWLTPVLWELVTMTVMPVRSLETDFTMDATGCSTHSFMRWMDYRTESEVQEHGWVKLHMICGALTNVITRAAVSPRDVHDNVLFRELFLETARYFRIRKLTADIAYLSGPNYALAEDFDVALYVPFKSNTARWWTTGQRGRRRCGSSWSATASSWTSTTSGATRSPRSRHSSGNSPAKSGWKTTPVRSTRRCARCWHTICPAWPERFECVE